jgi:hypothetical protein
MRTTRRLRRWLYQTAPRIRSETAETARISEPVMIRLSSPRAYPRE